MTTAPYAFLNEVAVNSKLDWNDNLAAIFEAKLVINQVQSFSTVSLGAVDTNLLGMYQYLMFLF